MASVGETQRGVPGGRMPGRELEKKPPRRQRALEVCGAHPASGRVLIGAHEREQPRPRRGMGP